MSARSTNEAATETTGRAPVATPAPKPAALRGWPRAVVRWLILTLVRPFISLRIEGVDQVPADGAFLLVANHLHNADPVLILAALRRPVQFMAKEELFRVPVLSAIVRLVGSFPVNRERPGRAAIRQAELLLAHDIPVGIFPEGTRSKTGALGPAFPGAGMIAVRSQRPIVPVAIWGTDRLPGGARAGEVPPSRRWPRSRYPVVIQFGEPFLLPPEIISHRRSASVATEIMMDAVARLLPEAYRGQFGVQAPALPYSGNSSGSSSSPRSSER